MEVQCNTQHNRHTLTCGKESEVEVTAQSLKIKAAKRYSIRIEKHLQCEKLLGLAGGNTKKHGNKKSGESRTPIRYNVIHMYIFAKLS